MSFDAADDFAAGGGWDEAARLLGLRTVGIEHDKTACRTAQAAGHARICADVSTIDRSRFAGIPGYIGSPPCTPWSKAGKRLGLLDQPAIYAHLDAVEAAGEWIDYPRDGWHDEDSPLVLEVVRSILGQRPQWIALEQVPDVLPFWERLASFLRTLGYRAWCGVLDAEMYGVAQTRDRAILIASRAAAHNASRPPATHQRYQPGRTPEPDLFGELLPWVSMADALGWGFEDEPARTVSAGGTETGGAEVFANAGYRKRLALHLARSEAFLAENPRRDHPVEEPSPAITSKLRSATWVETQNFSAVERDEDGHQTREGSVRYSRPTDAPSPCVTTQTRLWRYRDSDTRMAAAGATSVESAGTRLRDPQTEPSATITGKATAVWVVGRPATTVQADPRIASPGHRDREGGERQFDEQSVRVTYTEAAILQSFRPDYPWQGSNTKKFQQIGNAIPPLLAAAILGHLLGIEEWRGICRDWYRTERAA